MSDALRIALVTPPLVQLNTPYPAVPMLTRYLRKQGYQVIQRDFSLELIQALFSKKTLSRLAAEAAEKTLFHRLGQSYADTVEPVMEFLRGRKPELAWRIASRNWLPEGKYFESLSPTGDEDEDFEYQLALFGSSGLQEKARHIASLYMDDLAALIAQNVDSDFGFGKYAEHLAVSLRTLDKMLERLEKTTPVDALVDELSDSLAEQSPDFLGLSVPFPGTLLGALRIARRMKERLPNLQVVLGGGYVNSELRHLRDTRIFQFVDYISYDEGYAPLTAILDGRLELQEATRPGGNLRVRKADGLYSIPESCQNSLQLPDYTDLDLSAYLSLSESPIPMHRIWSDGCWLKLQLSRGCYWHKCAFCDVSLDYIGHYQPARAEEIVNAMETLMAETGRNGFHFVDEALAPALIDQVCREIIKRKLPVTWWGNVRFDKSFDEKLCALMAQAGCIAVTGGLECANDRLLKLMNKGITLASARKAMTCFAEQGIQVHAYLMYGFPTETYKEVVGALRFVRDCYLEAILHSSYWHRFALTVHSPIAKEPEKYGIVIKDDYSSDQLFALNELSYQEPGAPDWEKLGQGLAKANYNYILGQGLEMSAEEFLR